MPADLASLVANLAFVDEMYRVYRRDPAAVDPSWRTLFENGAWVAAAAAPAPAGAPALDAARFAGVWTLVNAYRVRGHLEADLDPLGMLERERHPDLDPRTYGFTDADLDRVVPSPARFDVTAAPLRELLFRLRATWCGPVGLELMHIPAPQKKAWLIDRMEGAGPRPPDRATRLAILAQLAAACAFERFVHTKYVGTKRFSIEGAETFMPLLDLVLEHAARLGAVEAVIGMAHRGRLNVLAGILGKPPREIFAEFEDLDPEATLGSGDVKYHLGYSTDRVTRAGRTLHLSLAFNPSHLEAVDPVVVGRVRAKQRRRKDGDHTRVIGVLVHGDAAFAGQGLVAETLNLSDLHGYRTGGTVHVIINNQIGFTTSPRESRSTPYPTDVAKMIQCPIWHVNGDDPDAVARVVEMALDYRAEFRSDVVINMFCYRKYGHSEADEPAFTQPLLYRTIERKRPVFELYAERLAADGGAARAEADAQVARHAAALEDELRAARGLGARPAGDALRGVWAGFAGGPDASVPDVDTAVPRARLVEVAERACALPAGFHPHPKIARLLAARLAMSRGERPIDWGMAEILAYGSLLWDGTLVRLSGQDSCRGTFSHRHAVVVDVTSGAEHVPLAHLHPAQGECAFHDSPLSEAAVLGFELGFSLDYPDGLVIWEAQFGDFVNGAQVILDQFLSSSEDKWRRLSGLVLLLPHGYEGQGPEHSSARYERFLQLAAEDNLQIVQPTTPAQMFHVLRRQVVRRWRKPLIVLTPKSLLRHPAAASTLDELAAGRFQRLLADDSLPADAVERVLLCSGKIYHELAAERTQRGDGRTAIVRVEQLYPLPDEAVRATLGRYPRARELVWVQDEPANMGAYRFAAHKLRRLLGPGAPLRAVTRAESASPATGSSRAHAIEQRRLLDEAFAG